MGKTIALKLSEKEHQVVVKLNKQGMTNSQLLRAALRQYFETSDKCSFQDFRRDKTLFTERKSYAEIVESIEELHQEIKDLWNKMENTQRKFESHMMNFQRLMNRSFYSDPISNKTTCSMKLDSISDVHIEIDEFLKKQKNW